MSVAPTISLVPKLGGEESEEKKLAMVTDEPGMLEANIRTPTGRTQFPLHRHLQRWWTNSYPGQWLQQRELRRRNQLNSLELKCSQYLADCANLSIPHCLTKFNSSLSTGLTDSQVPDLTSKHGANLLSTSKPRRWWSILLACIPNPFNVLLSILAIISIATQQQATFVILMIMVILSIGLRFWQERKNNVAVTELVKLVEDNVRVIRNGMEVEVAKTELVPGDIVRLGGGDVVPADVVLGETAGLYVNQSMLTGENMPVLKGLSDVSVEPHSILEATNICFSGTMVVGSSAKAIVVATGDDTYIGSLSQSLTQKHSETEFEKGIWRVSYMLIAFMLIMVPIVLIISGFVSNDWGSAALFCISVAVGITPEMLPMVINANLCHAALKLAKLKVIVKRLDSVQSLGGMDVLCSDKTGTLTEDEITLHSAVDAANATSEKTLQYAYLNALYQDGLRNAIDLAIVKYVKTKGGETVDIVQKYQKIAELPFDFERRLLSVVIGNESEQFMITKGAAEEVLQKCTSLHIDGASIPLNNERHDHLIQLCTTLNEQGTRVLAVATRSITDEKISLNSEQNLTFEGFLAFLDPPKHDAGQAISDLQKSGVTVKILTGDNVAAAKSVARKIGLLDDDTKIISGPELSSMSETRLAETVEQCIVFAKLKPLQKRDIVEILARNGHSVGFLGDGINDAPALRTADVGISVDTGTSVAKQAADIILLQKNLAHVVNGVLYGRITQANSLKYIKMAASSNFGNIFSVTVAAAWLPFVPMAPLQLLLQNLMYDISQATIPWDGVDKELTALPRKWHVWGIVRFMIWFGPTSSVFDICTFLLGWFFYGIRNTENNAAVETFQTQWFTEGLLTQVLVVVMLRTQHVPLIQSRPSKILGSALILICILGLAIPYIPPLANALQMQRPHPTFYGFLVAILVSYMLLVQLVKTVYRRIYGEWL